MIKKIVFISLLALLFTNCTIQKRTHQKGYFVQWNHKNYSKTEVTNKLTSELLAKKEEIQDTLLISENKLPDNTEIRGEDNTISLNIDKENSPKVGDEIIFQNSNILETKSSFEEQDNFKKKHSNKKEKKVKDEGIRFHSSFIFTLSTLLLGLILAIHGLSANYIQVTFPIGILILLVGIGASFISLSRYIDFRIKRRENRQIDPSLEKKYNIFKGFEYLLVLSFLALVLLAKQLL